jgi:hypothetical protein
LVHRLLEKNPADRPQSASAVVHELDRISADPTALAPTEHAALPTLDRGRCARCSTPLVTALDVCLSCRLPAPRLTRGNHTVFILGPGQLADKLDAGLRGKLLDWIEGSPSLNVDATRLSAKIPRLPFALATGVSEASGRAVVSSLAALGIEARAIEGGLRSLPEVRKKARMVGWRVFAIIAASSASMGFVVGKATLLWLFYPLLWVLVPTIVAANTFRPAARMRGEAKELPEPLASRLRNVARVGVELEARRHREALRGVVSRAMELREAAAPEDRDRTDAEVAQALDVAMVAAGRLDELDRRLERVDLREASAEVHTLMHERDTWSARLLDLTATLESFRARLAAAAAQVRPDEVEALDELRAKVEALEEVQTT